MKKEIKQYKDICNKIVELFCKKQDIDFDGWVSGHVGDIAGFCGQYFFSISDIVLDLETNQPIGKILQWQDEDVEFNSMKEFKQHINYYSYTKGLRHSHL